MHARLLNQEYKLLQLAQQKTLFELALLRSKINPHFLYNIHNSIVGLIAKDPQTAERLVLLLSRFFRFTLDKDSPTFHTVADEIDIVGVYLEMQQIRFGARLRFEIRAAEEVLSVAMPSFILQPLIENAIKHGIEKKTSAGFVCVDIGATDFQLVVKIADSGWDFPTPIHEGMGLQIVTNKLKLLYDNDFEIRLNNTPDKHVSLTIPRDVTHRFD